LHRNEEACRLIYAASDNDVRDKNMGLTSVTVSVGNPLNGDRREDVSCLVDSGAVYSLIPEPVRRSLGIQPYSTRDFVLADGQVVHRRLATATFEYEGRRGDSMCIFSGPPRRRGREPPL
jgi:predicted aspartyl protease